METIPLDTLQRRSRMSQTPTARRLQLTDRDIKLFRLLTRYRYLRSTHLYVLLGAKSKGRFIERLGHLYRKRCYAAL